MCPDLISSRTRAQVRVRRKPEGETPNAWRKASRAADSAATLDAASAVPADEPGPAESALSREEETVVWRTLEQIPETYREPLILFYREDQAVAEVAAALDLSEDAVKQRLSRGRDIY